MKSSVHGVVIEHTSDLVDDPMAGFFSAFGVSDDPPTMSMRVSRTVALPARPAKRPVYFLGAVQVSRDDDGWSLFDGDTRVDVARDGSRIDATVGGGEVPPLVGGILHAALLLALRLVGFFEMHAAGVVFGDASALLIGDAGVGKTTALFSCVQHDARFLSDDRVLFRDATRLLAYPREAHLSEATIAALPTLAGVTLHGPSMHQKRRGDVRAVLPDRYVASAPWPRALVFPELVAGVTSVAPVSAADALGRLIEASALAAVEEVPGGRMNLVKLGAMADAVPGFALRLGRDALDRPALVADAIRTLVT